MSNRERRLARASFLIDRDLREAADELREARLRHGLTLQAVADALGTSKSDVLRRERARGPGPRPDILARHAAAVGLRARIKVYPDGAPLHDAPQVALLTAFRSRLHPDLEIKLETPVIATPGFDGRAFDLVIGFAAGRGGVDGFTRFRDCQAQLRGCLLKQRDSGVERLFILVAGTRHNRLAVASACDLIASAFPLNTRPVMAALAAGRDPGANGLIFL